MGQLSCGTFRPQFFQLLTIRLNDCFIIYNEVKFRMLLGIQELNSRSLEQM